MKSQQKGFIIPLLLTLLALVFIGGGVYVYTHNNSNNAEVTQVDNSFATSGVAVIGTSTVSASSQSTISTPSASIDLSSLSFSPSNFTLTGTAAGTDTVEVYIVANAASFSGYRTLFGNGSVPVLNGHWSLVVPPDTFNGNYGPYKVEVGIGFDSSGEVNAVATGTLSISTAQTIQAEATAYGVQPTNTTSWQTYTNNQYGFSIQYPSTFTQQNLQGGDNPKLTFEANYPASYFGNTDLNAANIQVHVTTSTENDCQANDWAGNPARVGLESGAPATLIINGITFYTAYEGDASAGGSGDEDSYLNTYHNNLCYSIEVSAATQDRCFNSDDMSCTNPPSYSADTQIFPIFNQIAATFQFTN